MTRKDYELIASALRSSRLHLPSNDERQAGAKDQWETTVEEVADDLERENPRFDRNKFLTACGLEA
jgi:hypothetical protein